MSRLIHCPYGHVYDGTVHAECPCPSSWADRSSAGLAAVHDLGPERQHTPQATTSSRANERSPIPQLGHQISFLEPEISRPQTGPWELTITPASAAFLLATFAVFSALLSIHLMNPWTALQFSIYSQQKAPLLPGIYFASVTCIGVYLWEKSSRATIIGTFAMVVVAWAAAWDTAVAVYDMLSKFESSAELKTISAQVVAGSAAGFVGSAITAFGVSFASPNFRKPVTWIRTILIGTVAGSLLDDRLFGMRLHFLQNSGLLFLVWQPAVAASIAYGLVRPKWSRLPQSHPPETGRLLGRPAAWHLAALSAALLALVLHSAYLAYLKSRPAKEVTFSEAGTCTRWGD